MLRQIPRSLLAGPRTTHVGILGALQSQSQYQSQYLSYFRRSQSTQTKSESASSMDPTSIAQVVNNTTVRNGSEDDLDLFSYKRKSRQAFNNNKLDLGESKISLDANEVAEVDALKYAQSLPLLGHESGRGLSFSPGRLRNIVNPFNKFVRANNLQLISRSQQYHLKPSKRKAQKKFFNKKKRFNKGIKQLFNIVADAIRKGY